MVVQVVHSSSPRTTLEVIVRMMMDGSKNKMYVFLLFIYSSKVDDFFY